MGLNGRKIDSGGFEFIDRFLRPLGCLILVRPFNFGKFYQQSKKALYGVSNLQRNDFIGT
jgi:hypothetical protein